MGIRQKILSLSDFFFFYENELVLDLSWNIDFFASIRYYALPKCIAVSTGLGKALDLMLGKFYKQRSSGRKRSVQHF